MAVSGSSGADELSSLEIFCSDVPAQYKPGQWVKYSDKKKNKENTLHLERDKEINNINRTSLNHQMT